MDRQPRVTLRLWRPVTPAPEAVAALAARPVLRPVPRPPLERYSRRRLEVPGRLISLDRSEGAP